MNEPTTHPGGSSQSSVERRPEIESLGFELLGSEDLRRRKRQLLEEQRSRWASASPAPPGEFLPRWPTDPEADPDVASLLFEDLIQRHQHGAEASGADDADRFADHEPFVAQLISQPSLPCALGSSRGGPARALRLPQVGEEVFGFRLRDELGRGAFAQVFLAEQADLAGRLVAVKVSAIEGSEPRTLAQMQHTHIVPIYSVHEDPRAGLRAVCMPYFGGASLFLVLKELWQDQAVPLHGRQLVEALAAVGGPPPAAAQGKETGRPEDTGNEGGTPASLSPCFPVSWPYVQAVAWIVARLAEGLQHAHRRGVLHRDVKPSNVLLGADGQPMLLDFNVSQDQDTDPAQAVLGGTFAYMAPEHLRAAIGCTAALTRLVDHRADIYSLGMVLFEMLAGHRPFDESSRLPDLRQQVEAMAAERSRVVPSLRRERPDVPWSLESIIRRCLAPDPADRYQQAEHLAEDLRRFLEDRPLRHAPELSRVELAGKWVRRHSRLTTAGAVAAVAALLLLGVGFNLASVRNQLAGTWEQLSTVRGRVRKQAFEAGTVRALCLVNTTLDLQDHLRQGAAVCEETLALYDGLVGDTWHEPSDWARLLPDDRRRLAEDARELLLLLAAARVRMAPVDPDVLAGALALVDRAEAIPGIGPSRALWLDRASYLGRRGRADQARTARQRAEQITVVSARDHYLLATSLARQGGPENHARAVAELNLALDLDPRHYWSWSQRGLCYIELGELELAAADFGHCTGLWPEFAWGYFNLGYVHDRAGRKAEAINCYTQALAHDPGLVAAHVNRGLACLELERGAQALADFDQALAQGPDEPSLRACRGMALEALGRHAEADESFKVAFSHAGAVPAPTHLRMLWAYGFAVAHRLPEDARRAFDGVIRQDPGNAKALYGLAMLAAEKDQIDEALRFFDRALQAAPNFFEARRYRAVLQARSGALEGATADINWCLEKEPRAGGSLYAAACVAALAAERLSDTRLQDQALVLLRKAFAGGIKPERAQRDPDLAGLRDQPKFKQLLAQAQQQPGPLGLWPGSGRTPRTQEPRS
jgi:serine/threonine protein kinase/tetratricopeptide (TPR) repeat protein